ncbi:unnamed protein product [Rhizoctonia solani]|uniref:Uncharacterized protein n=1 Tax=Rhizoctonia solani TaxID=456999 RepID=A0A8H3D4X3_9AGAM|nr:unnamed protein product [Rhizoctonia solani]
MATTRQTRLTGIAFDFSQCATELADAATLLSEAARELSDAARAMRHEPQSGSHITPKSVIDGVASQDSGCEPNSDHDASDCRSATEDGNTGNNLNAHRPNSRLGTSSVSGHLVTPAIVDQPAIRGENNLSRPQQTNIVPSSDDFRDVMLSPGRYYIVLDEEFNILPLIAAYAAACHKTLSCMPFIEPSQSWRALLSAISPSHEVLEVSSQPSAISPCDSQYITSEKPSILVQSFTVWQTGQTVSSISDSFLIWGFLTIGPEQLAGIKESVLHAKHTCAIVAPQEYQRPNFKSYLTSLGFIEHPKLVLINDYNHTSSLFTYRVKVQGVLRDPKFRSNICHLYKTSLLSYNFPPNRNIWTKTRVAQMANGFAAKILLHGREEYGSSRFKPDGQTLPVDQPTILKCGLGKIVQLRLLQEDSPLLVPTLGAASKSMVQRDGTPASDSAGRWYIPLQQDFDAIPFICYQAEHNPKVICFISYGTNATPYTNILELLTTRQIVHPGDTQTSVKKGLATFSSEQSALLMLRGLKAVLNPVDYLDIDADVVICWGVPPEPHFTNRMNTPRAKYTYILFTTADDVGARQRVTSKSWITPYPGTIQINSGGPQSPLHSYRERTVQTMMSISSNIADEIYDDQIQNGRDVLGISILESVIRANQFAARVLLHGDPREGSLLYPPLRPRPCAYSMTIDTLGLQPCIDQGLMSSRRSSQGKDAYASEYFH